MEILKDVFTRKATEYVHYKLKRPATVAITTKMRRYLELLRFDWSKNSPGLGDTVNRNSVKTFEVT